MSLERGFRLGPYEIQEPIGAGGMGEVYSAQDTRLNRVVAIKVLPGHLVSQGHLVERFEREARAISSLQHPSICALYDVGHDQGLHYLVMEYLQGETLGARLMKGKLNPETAVDYGRQIADALHAAHKKGVVHRDLKPGNIMITQEGLKLLDFGLAKMGEPPSDPGSGTLPGLSGIETRTMPNTPLTQEGTILGTFQYMAPEQLEGKDADSRTDIFALGTILYEMITGQKAFHGDSQASLIASIMSSSPRPATELEVLTPPALDAVIRTCLAKSPEDRWQTAHDVALQLKWIAEGGSQVGLPVAVSSRRKSRELSAWILSLVFFGAFLAMAVFWWMSRPADDAYTMRFQVPVVPGIGGDANPKISPDGRALAYLASDSTGVTRIWVHRLNALEPQALPGTEGAERPFWSPDSRYLAFFAGQGKLKKVSIAGGPPVAVGESPGGADGSWGSSGVILFDQSATDSVHEIPAAGGVPKPATRIYREDGETGSAWPYFMPDGERFLFLGLRPGGEPPVLRAGRLGSLESKVIGQVGTRFEYVEPGYLLYVQSGTLVSRPFDADAMEFTGEPVPIAEDVSGGGVNFQGSFSASLNGVLTFWSNPRSGVNRLVWLDREGSILGDAAEAGAYGDFNLSPDETKVVASIIDPALNAADLWILDLIRGTRTRFTFDSANDRLPVWSPDGSRIAFASDTNENGLSDLYVKSASGLGEPQPLVALPDVVDLIHDWSRDGQWLSLGTFESGTRLNLWAAPADNPEERIEIARTPYHEHWGRFSPDARWLAYATNESGAMEVYVRGFPESQGKWQISVRGGTNPRWSHDGKYIYYISPANRLVGVEVDGEGSGFRTGLPEDLFDLPSPADDFTWSRYQPSKDGERFLMMTPARGRAPSPITVVLNWQEELGSR